MLSTGVLICCTVPSEAVPLFIWLLFVVSSVPHFRPDTGGRRSTLIRVASSLALRGGMALLSLLRCSGSRLLYMECALRAPRGSSPRVFHKSAEQKAAPAFCAFPVRLRAAQAARSFLLVSICMEYLFPTLHFQSVCVPCFEVGPL